MILGYRQSFASMTLGRAQPRASTMAGATRRSPSS